MKENLRSKLTPIDNETYNELQKLIKFVDFVTSLEYCTEIDRINAAIIINRIKELNNPETYCDWDICIDIYDLDIQFKLTDRNGIYWKTWSVSFEDACLEIRAESYHSDTTHNLQIDFNFNSTINFKDISGISNPFSINTIDDFLCDAFKFGNYITEDLNEIEVVINIY